MTLRFAVQEHLLAGDTLLQKWDAAQTMGFEGIELRGEGGPALEARLPELRDAYQSGVRYSSVCVIMDRFIGDFKAGNRSDALSSMKTLLSVIAELGGTGAITPAAFGLHSNFLPPFKAPRSASEDEELLLDALQELGDHASSVGSLLLLEPLNRYEDHMLNRLDEGVKLLKTLNHDSVRLMADLFHMNIEERDSAAAIDAAMPYVAHLHLADSNRLEPGQGQLDFASVFKVLSRHQYQGYCAIECFTSGDVRLTMNEAIRFLKQAELSTSAVSKA